MDLSNQRSADSRAFAAQQMDLQAQQREAAREKMEAKREAVEEYQMTVLKASMEPAAFERLRRVALVKPERAQAAQNYLLQLCQRQRMGGPKIDEATVRSVLEKVTEVVKGPETVGQIQFRRKALADSDDDF